MNYAIIAAGEGSRLVDEGVSAPKPLVKLNGVTLIDRLINIFLRNQAESITIIINDMGTEVKQHIEGIKLNIPFNIIVKSTPSSMHSFYELMPYLKQGKFCLTTVDTVFEEQEFSSYIRTFTDSKKIDGLMAVTSYIDDESPLYVSCDGNNVIDGFLDSDNGSCKYISGGIYCLTPAVFNTLEKAMSEGKSRMRNFQRQLVSDGLRLKIFEFSKIVDVDHAEDINKAELFLNTKQN